MSWVWGCHCLQWRADVVWVWASPGVCLMPHQTSHQLLSSALGVCCLPTGHHKETPRFGERKPRATEFLQLFGDVISWNACRAWWLILPRKHKTFNEHLMRQGKDPLPFKNYDFGESPLLSYDQKELRYIIKALWHKKKLCGYSVCFKFGCGLFGSFSN